MTKVVPFGSAACDDLIDRQLIEAGEKAPRLARKIIEETIPQADREGLVALLRYVALIADVERQKAIRAAELAAIQNHARQVNAAFAKSLADKLARACKLSPIVQLDHREALFKLVADALADQVKRDETEQKARA